MGRPRIKANKKRRYGRDWRTLPVSPHLYEKIKKIQKQTGTKMQTLVDKAIQDKYEIKDEKGEGK